jgi:hypothetical protein
MSELGKLSYRICKNETGWQWQLLGTNRTVVAEGFAEESFKARTRAILATLTCSRQERHPENFDPGLVAD